MLRFVVGPGAVVVPDIRHKLPGRGVWVEARADTVAQAVKRQAFSRGFKTKVSASATLASEIEDLLRQDCLQSLSIVNKAGQVITGFAKVEAKIAEGGIAGLVHACDGGSDGTRKLTQALRRRFGRSTSAGQSISGPPMSGQPMSDLVSAEAVDETTIPQIKLFESGQLDLALGRTNVIHAALIAGTASEAFLVRCRRLALYLSAASQDMISVPDGGPDDVRSGDGRACTSGTMDDGRGPGTRDE
jgi:predicted RNA-binding protein YlxR (DUF448 family)